MRAYPQNPRAVHTRLTGRPVGRILTVLLVAAAMAAAGTPAASALLDGSLPAPRTSLARGSALDPMFGPRLAGLSARQPEPAPAPQPAPTPAPEPAPAPPAPDPQPEPTADSAAPPPGPRTPTGSHWAVVIGADDYQSPTADTYGSAGDARLLTRLLRRNGWQDDHVRTLGDGEATGANIRRAFRWLARKADERSTVVVSFSGHMDHRHTPGGTVAGLWTQDNDRIWRGEFARMMGAVDARRMWISLQGCYAGGLAAPGVEGANRLVTYSSHASQASYDDPRAGHSVMGNFLFREGLAQGWGNGGEPEGVSVQDAFRWAAPRVRARTGGRQDPVMSDRLGRPFTLELTPAPARR